MMETSRFYAQKGEHEIKPLLLSEADVPGEVGTFRS